MMADQSPVGFEGAQAFVDDAVDFPRDRHGYVISLGELEDHPTRVDTFGDHAHFRHDLVELAALAELLAHTAVPAQRADACSKEIAKTREPCKSLRLSPHGD